MATKAELLAEATKQLMEQAKIRGEMSNSLESYLNTLKEVKAVNDTIKSNEKAIADLQAKSSNFRGKDLKAHKEKIAILENVNKKLTTNLNITKENLKTVNATNLVMAKMGSTAVKSLGALPGILSNSFGKLKGYGLFEMDKAIKMSALQMGLLGKEADSYAMSIRDTAKVTNIIGVNVEALAKMQGQYAEGLGRTVMLGDKGLKAMAAMSVATGLGAEGAGDLALNMEEIGISAESTGKFIGKTMNDSHKMGLNASKVVKNIQGGMKLMNKYNFKDGVKGLANMAETAAKLGVRMEFAAGMSDKLWDIEGAVDMSAQLQVMGGAWAKMADPFHLMFMARNDMEGLTKEIANASQESMYMAKDGSIQMSSMAMSKLKIIAQQTGVEYDELVKSGKELFKMNKVKQQIGLSVDDETKEFIANTAQMKDGKATIEIDGSTKLVSQLTSGDQDFLRIQMAEKKSMEERAEASQNFDDKMTNLINQFKTYMLPIIDGINQTLGPILTDFMKDPKWQKGLMDIGKQIGGFIVGLKPVVETVANFIKMLGPTGTLVTLFSAKVLFNVAQWFSNGLALSSGFMAGSGGITSGLKSLGTGILKVGGYIGLATAAIQIGSDALKNAKDPTLSTGDAISKTLWDNKGKIIGGAIGAGLGFLAGGVNAVPGAGIGASLGGMLDKPSNDAMFGAPMHDGVSMGMAGGAGLGMAMGGPLGAFMGSKFGDDFSKGRGIIQGGKVHPIDNKDDLLAMKKGGVVDKANKSANIPSTITHIFNPIEFKGSITINSPGNPGQTIDLLKNQDFISNITSMIHIETQKQIGGGKSRG